MRSAFPPDAETMWVRWIAVGSLLFTSLNRETMQGCSPDNPNRHFGMPPHHAVEIGEPFEREAARPEVGRDHRVAAGDRDALSFQIRSARSRFLACFFLPQLPLGRLLLGRQLDSAALSSSFPPLSQ